MLIHAIFLNGLDEMNHLGVFSGDHNDDDGGVGGGVGGVGGTSSTRGGNQPSVQLVPGGGSSAHSTLIARA